MCQVTRHLEWEYTGAFVQKALRETAHAPRLLVLDEGGFLLQHVYESGAKTAHVAGVEQTTSGFERVKHFPFDFPVVNVARSSVKLSDESPMIARVVVRMLCERVTLTSTTRVAVVGQGAVGRAIAALLRERCVVLRCDAEKDVCDFAGAYRDQLSTCDIIIGATGTQMCTIDDCQKFRPGTVLVSASSSDREFPAVAFRVANGTRGGCHEDLVMHGIRLLNGGFPINFDGSEHSVFPPRDVQLTRALLLAGMYEALASDRMPGFRALSDLQFCIAEEFRRMHATR